MTWPRAAVDIPTRTAAARVTVAVWAVAPGAAPAVATVPRAVAPTAAPAVATAVWAVFTVGMAA